MDVFTLDQLLQMVICGAITSILGSAFSTVFDKVQGKTLLTVVAIIALVVTLLRTTFFSTVVLVNFAAKFAFAQSVVLVVLLTWAFAIIFWFTLGKKFVDKLFTFVWAEVQKRLGGVSTPSEPTTPPETKP
jgi:hypothetical protein